MTCVDCGAQTPNRRCRPCALDRRFGDGVDADDERSHEECDDVATDGGRPTDGEMVDACPECDSTRIHNNNASGIHGTRSDIEPHTCHNCGAGFQTPRTRESRGGGNIRPDSVAGKLLDASPDDVQPSGGDV
jgi:hypothetical protein